MRALGVRVPVLRVRGPRRLLLLGGSAAVIAAVAAAVVGRELVMPDATTSPPGDGMVRFDGRDGSFSISYPSGWSRLSSSDDQVELIAAQDATGSFLVRVVPLDFEVLPEGLPRAKTLTDRLVGRARRVKQLSPPQEIRLGGLPGFLYIYKFEDSSTRQTGAHAHYFLFQGARMITLVFQALPADRLAHFAPTFERIASSFRAGTVPG